MTDMPQPDQGIPEGAPAPPAAPPYPPEMPDEPIQSREITSTKLLLSARDTAQKVDDIRDSVSIAQGSGDAQGAERFSSAMANLANAALHLTQAYVLLAPIAAADQLAASTGPPSPPPSTPPGLQQ